MASESTSHTLGQITGEERGSLRPTTLFFVDRDAAGFSDEQLQAGSIRSVMCVPWFPGLRWIRSLFDPARRRSRCIYEASSAEQIRLHSIKANLPVEGVRPIVDLGGPTKSESSSDQPLRDPDGVSQLWVARHALGASRQEQIEQALCPIVTDLPEGLIRAYADDEVGEIFTIYRVASGSVADRTALSLGFPVLELWAVQEILPSDFPS